MKHLKKINEKFEPKEIVTYKGNICQVIEEYKDQVEIKMFKPIKILKVDKSLVKHQIKCLSNCDKRIVGQGNKRYLKCFYCGKEQKYKK